MWNVSEDKSETGAGDGEAVIAAIGSSARAGANNAWAVQSRTVIRQLLRIPTRPISKLARESPFFHPSKAADRSPTWWLPKLTLTPQSQFVLHDYCEVNLRLG